MPQTSGHLEQTVHITVDSLTEPNDRLHRSPPKKNGLPSPPSVNGSVKSGIGGVHSNGLVVGNGGLKPSHAKSHANGLSVVVHRPVPPAASSDGCIVIREVYENGLATEYFALQLDCALDAGAPVIVIEPSRLGRETATWLAIGAGLRRTALSVWSLCVIAAALRRDGTCLLCAATAGAMVTVYTISWRPDPCSKYRVERNLELLQRLPLRDVVCTAPVVLVRRQHSRLRHGIYGSVALATLGICAWRLYNWQSV